MIYQNKVYFVLILFSRKLAKFYFSTDFVEFFKCTISLVKNKFFYFSLQSLYFCYCFILHRVGSEVQGWLEKIIMGTPILHFISKRMFSNFQVWCLLWTPFIEWATWMNIWGKNLRKVRVRSLRRDVLWTFEKHQEGQCGCSRGVRGAEGTRRWNQKVRTLQRGAGRCDCARQYRAAAGFRLPLRVKPLGIFQQGASQSDSHADELLLCGFESRMERTRVINTGRPMRRLSGIVQVRDDDWPEPVWLQWGSEVIRCGVYFEGKSLLTVQMWVWEKNKVVFFLSEHQEEWTCYLVWWGRRRMD